MGRAFPFCVHAHPAWGMLTHTLLHIHSLMLSSLNDNTLQMADSITCSTWVEKKCLRAYHWLQTYCLHCHINLIQKLSKGPLGFIYAFAFIFFYFRGEERNTYDTLACTTDFLQWALKTAGETHYHFLSRANDTHLVQPQSKVMEKNEDYKFEVSSSYSWLKLPTIHTVPNQKLKCGFITGRQPS